MAENGTEDVCRHFKVLITRPDMPPSALALLSEYELDIWNENAVMPREVFLRRVQGKHALFISSQTKIDAEVLDAAGSNLKVIGTISSGYEHIDVKEVKRRGIKVGYTAGILSDAVAEYAVGLLLSITRRLFEAHTAAMDGTWTEWTPWTWLSGFGLKDSVIGIIGLGGVGLEVARRLVPFKPSKILYSSRSVAKRAEDVRAVRVELDDLLKESDVVVICCSLNETTLGLINDEKFGLMKTNAFLVNVSRGAVVVTDALIRALKSNRIRGAAIDVMTPEPLPLDSELLKLDNCIVSPHIGSSELATRIKMAELISKNIIAGLNGDPLLVEL